MKAHAGGLHPFNDACDRLAKMAIGLLEPEEIRYSSLVFEDLSQYFWRVINKLIKIIKEL